MMDHLTLVQIVYAYNEGSCVGVFEGLDVSTPTLGSSSGELEAYGER